MAAAKLKITNRNIMIHKNMMSSESPLRHLDKEIWDYGKQNGKWSDKISFNATYDMNKRQLLSKGTQPCDVITGCYREWRTYKIWQKKQNQYVFMKEYDVSGVNLCEFKKPWHEFVFFKTSKLLKYFTFYHDKEKEVIMIVSEYLDYTLNDYISKLGIQAKTNKNNINKYTLITSESECKIIVLNIMDKLWKIHKSGYVHGDLTPNKIMIKNGSIMINGFETCRIAYNSTVCWSAPELHVFSSGVSLYADYRSFAADIWSLGLIILYTLFGNQPYQFTKYEQSLFGDDEYQKKSDFYYKKLLRLKEKPNGRRKRFGDDEKSFFKGIIGREHKRKWRECREYDNIFKSCGEIVNFKYGQEYISSFLLSLHKTKKISYQLYDLLNNCMLTFNPSKRLNCTTLYRHKWFKSIRQKIND